MNNNFFISPSLSNFLNLLRWVSAFIVLLSHLRSIMFIDLPNITTSLNIFWKFFYFITGFGHQAVIVFFVISGFLVGSSMLRRVKKNQLNFREYLLVDRGVRIYIVLIPALLLTLILDWSGSHYFNSSGIYSGVLHFSSLDYSIIERLNLETFLCNVLMLQESFCTTFGSDSPLWSLAYEVWYYVIFFLVLQLFSRKNIIINIIFLSLIFIFLNKQILLYFLIWLIGVAIWFIQVNISKSIFYINILFLMFILVVVRLHLFEIEFMGDLFLSIFLALIIYAIQQEVIHFNILNNINHTMSKFSYTLYLVHFPLIIFLVSIIHKYTNFPIQNKPSGFMLFYFIFMSIFLLIFSYSFYLISEANTKYIQQRLNQ